MKRLRVTISGRVQGVFFRAVASAVASKLGLTGFVRNLPDGNVEALAEGEKQMLEKFLSWCHVGPPSAVVTHVDFSFEDATGEFLEFSIR